MSDLEGGKSEVDEKTMKEIESSRAANVYRILAVSHLANVGKQRFIMLCFFMPLCCLVQTLAPYEILNEHLQGSGIGRFRVSHLPDMYVRFIGMATFASIIWMIGLRSVQNDILESSIVISRSPVKRAWIAWLSIIAHIWMAVLVPLGTIAPMLRDDMFGMCVFRVMKAVFMLDIGGYVFRLICKNTEYIPLLELGGYASDLAVASKSSGSDAVKHATGSVLMFNLHRAMTWVCVGGWLFSLFIIFFAEVIIDKNGKWCHQHPSGIHCLPKESLTPIIYFPRPVYSGGQHPFY